MQQTTPYRGRFAPSPTGPLHFGSLVAAVASYAQALVAGGEWLVRVEDIDPPREAPGATESILASLVAHGFEFPPADFQSSRLPRFDALIEQLLAAGLAYPCNCSRKTLARTARRGRAGLIYPGTCRDGPLEAQGNAKAVRLRTRPGQVVRFEDGLQGSQSCTIEAEIGDVLLRRGDGLVAYQLAVAADDHFTGITEVVRGTDLLDSTFMQLAVFEALGWQPPAYLHVPVATGPDGSKLSKQTGALPIDDGEVVPNLLSALRFLGQSPPADLAGTGPEAVWRWVRHHWNPAVLAGLRERPEKSNMMQ